MPVRLSRFLPTSAAMTAAAGLLAGAVQASSSLPERPFGADSAAGRCVVCHSLERNGPYRSAPNLFGIVGDRMARADWYGYSHALSKKGGNWTEEELDAYLKNPSAFAPGTRKTIPPIADAEERRRIIDYLKTLR